MNANAFEQLLSVWCRGVQPSRQPMTLSERAAALTVVDGAMQGEQYSVSRHPAQREAIEQLQADRYRRYVILAPAQDGKTLLFLALQLWSVVDVGDSVFLLMPDRELLGKLWRNKYRKTIQRSGLDWVLPTSGPGSATGVPSDLQARTGAVWYLAAAGGANEAGQAAVTAKRVVIDERDKVRDRFAAAAEMRAEIYGDDGRVYLISTISHDVGSPTLAEYERSVCGRVLVSFGCCGRYQTLGWSQVSYDGATPATARDTARIACEHCGVAHDDHARVAALVSRARVVYGEQTIDVAGNVVGAVPRVESYGLRWSALDSPYRDLGRLCALHLEAQRAIDEHGNHELMRQFYRDQLVQVYRHAGGAKNVLEAGVAARSAAGGYSRGVVPDEVSFLVAGVDVQLDRCYALVLGRSVGGAWVLIDWLERYWSRRDQEPTDQMRHDVLSAMRREWGECYCRSSGVPVPVYAVAVDVRYAKESIGRWIARTTGTIAVMGVGFDRERSAAEKGGKLLQKFDAGMAELREVPKAAGDQPDVRLVVQTAEYVDRLRSAWAIQPGEPGSICLPQGIAADDAIARHLTGIRVKVNDSGVTVQYKHRTRIDWLHCLVYAQVLASVVTTATT